MSKIKVICVMAKSGTGKSTAIDELCKNNIFHYVKSFTTRDVRQNDPKDKETHIFISEKQYEEDKAKNKILALYESPTGYHSYTTKDNFDEDKINIYAIDVLAFNNLVLKEMFSTYGIYLFLDEEKRKQRIEARDGKNTFKKEEHLSKEHLISDYSIIDIENMTPKQVANKMEELIWQEID